VPKPDRLERLTDLVLVLLNTRRPLTLDAIANQVPGYPSDHDARRQAFERDKRLLRDEGIPVRTEPVDGQEQFGYRIDADTFYLTDLGLDAEEQTALHLAVAGVHLGDPSGRNALLKIGATGLTETRPVASVASFPALVPMFDAIRTRATLSFTYHGVAREVSPARMWFRDGHWYLVGWDATRDDRRTFRVDRIEDWPVVGEPDSRTLPEGFDPGLGLNEGPLSIGDEDQAQQVTLRVDAIEAPRVIEEVGEGAVVSHDEDGSVTSGCSTTPRCSTRPTCGPRSSNGSKR
jgi:predicted DNA-binding transcriptional regulator YafY